MSQEPSTSPGSDVFAGAAEASPDRSALTADNRPRRYRFDLQEIGQSLHDDIGQELTGLVLKVESLKALLAQAAVDDRGLIESILASLQLTRRKVRSLSHGLIPVTVDGQGLTLALSQLAAEIDQLTPMRCRFQGDPRLSLEDERIATQLLHIAQEAVNNALRHGGGDRLEIGLGRSAGELILSIRDNGRGLLQRGPSGSGLRSMRQRTDGLNGRLDLRPIEGGGTEVICRIPCAWVEDEGRSTPGHGQEG